MLSVRFAHSGLELSVSSIDSILKQNPMLYKPYLFMKK